MLPDPTLQAAEWQACLAALSTAGAAALRRHEPGGARPMQRMVQSVPAPVAFTSD